MAELALCGSDLMREIQTADPPAGCLDFWWLGQHGFALAGGGAVVFIDAYLHEPPNGRRATPAPLKASETAGVTYFLGTHDHSDHVDRASLPDMLAASPAARLVVSRVVERALVKDGYPADRLIGLDHGQVHDDGTVSITAVKAAHEFLDEDPELGFPHLGFAVRMNGATIFHTGDGVPWEGLHSAVRALAPDALFVPINGRDAERYLRNCIGNFTFQEAVDLVGFVRPGLAVPTHYDMFPGNQERVERFTDYLEAKYPGIACWVGRVGEGVRVTAGG